VQRGVLICRFRFCNYFVSSHWMDWIFVGLVCLCVLGWCVESREVGY